MESNYRNSGFEQYIKESADQYRMFPSDKVWKGINNTLHTRRKWYGAGLAFLLLLTGTAVTWVMVSYPVSKNQQVAIQQPSIKATTQPAISPDVIKTVIPFSSPAVTAKATVPAAATTPVLPELNEQENPAPEFETYLAVSSGIEKTQPHAVSVQKSPASKNVMTGQPTEEEKNSPDVSNTVTAAVTSVVMPHPDALYPLTIESVTNAYQPKKTRKKISWQLYLTPTVSYRKLTENKSQPLENAAAGGFPFASMTDVNKAVTHKPDVGFQLGLSGHYPVTRNLKIRVGLQFNMNRYDIKASAYNPEMATITLDGGANGTTNATAWTYYRNYNGYKSNWLKNFYFSVSAPIGAELKLLGNKKTSLGIAGTIQPTYIIKDRAYLISNDYKNYAKFPWLVRNVNLSTGFETFINHTSGKTRWQVGPQVRYQLLSSFHNRYPVKENLFDFGVKVGVTLNNN